MRFHPFIHFFLFCSIATPSLSQPYIDLVSVQAVITRPTSIISDAKYNASTNWYSGVFTYPHQFKNKSVLICTAGLDAWKLMVQDNYTKFQTGYLPITYVKPLSEKWKFSLTAIPRYSSEEGRAFNNVVWQLGGAIIATRIISSKLSLKGGVYYNKEFFGNNFLPLLGCDWKANDRLNIFGLLPNNLFVDYKISNKFHSGFIYKGITSSFRLKESNDYDYVLPEEGQLKLFVDYYITKNIVLNFEGGHTVARNYGFGFLNEKAVPADFNDGYILKAGLYYRMWL